MDEADRQSWSIISGLMQLIELLGLLRSLELFGILGILELFGLVESNAIQHARLFFDVCCLFIEDTYCMLSMVCYKCCAPHIASYLHVGWWSTLPDSFKTNLRI